MQTTRAQLHAAIAKYCYVANANVAQEARSYCAMLHSSTELAAHKLVLLLRSANAFVALQQMQEQRNKLAAEYKRIRAALRTSPLQD